jgi:CO/xanthine dehydrogenase FAD-binding subunit
VSQARGERMAIYLRPTGLNEALVALAADAANMPVDPLDRLTVLAGATDFYPVATMKQAWFQPTAERILDISAVAGLHGISETADGFRIGALTTWTDLIHAPLPPAFDGLKQASRQVGGVQIQNRGTIAGNICNASPAADGVPPLLALDAEVELVSVKATRRLPLSQFILGNRKTALQPGELLTAIHMPRPTNGEQSVFLKLGARAYLVISIASVATNIYLDAQGRIAHARIAVGSCSAVPQRLSTLEDRLQGLSPAAASRTVDASLLAALSPIDDVRASGSYRREAALMLVRRALDGLAAPREQAA